MYNGRVYVPICIPSIIGRAGASPPNRATGAIFLYIYIYIYVCPSDTLPYIYFTVALRANVKPAQCKFKGRQFFHDASHSSTLV